MAVDQPFAVPPYLLPSCTLRALVDADEAGFLGHLLATMPPWQTLRYTTSALQRYLLHPDPTLYRYAVVVQETSIGVVGVRYPWLRGAYLELLGLTASYQGWGIGREILDWIEAQTRTASHNVWVLVSSFNSSARRFYARQGYREIGTLSDFVQPGYDEILLRKVL